MSESEPQHDYLWDREGQPQPEVKQLETLLGRYRYELPLRFPAPARAPKRVLRWRRLMLPAGALAAAACVFAVGLGLIAHFGQPGEQWKVVATAGQPAIGSRAIHGSAVLGAGGVLSTDANSSAELRAGAIGRIEVEPESVLRLVTTERGRHRLALEHGRIRARLWAAPFTFAFRTPGATAFDLGCAFTLAVEKNGRGLVHVDSGWVEFESDDRQSLIPAGAEAIALPEYGPGTPFFADAAPAFKAALEKLDFGGLTPAERPAALAIVLRHARAEDGFTLLNLLRRSPEEEHGAIYDRLAHLVPPPEGVTREGMLRGDTAMLGRYWHALGMGNVKSWWMHWRDLL